MAISEQFAHVLLFSCPNCDSPLASACASTRKNLEPAEAHWFNPHCHCGWTGDVMGVNALGGTLGGSAPERSNFVRWSATEPLSPWILRCSGKRSGRVSLVAAIGPQELVPEP
jgi:hypothetical protein